MENPITMKAKNTAVILTHKIVARMKTLTTTKNVARVSAKTSLQKMERK
jgi:hypothetical protein